MNKNEKSATLHYKTETAVNGSKVNVNNNTSAKTAMNEKSEVQSEKFKYASFGKPAMGKKNT